MTPERIISVQSHKLHTKQGKRINVQCYVFEMHDLAPVTAVVYGEPRNLDFPLVRIHSRCMYSEVFGSVDCDCREQLEKATDAIVNEGAGIFIYLEQEGRGCGLVNKARAYHLKDAEGMDTVDAYERLDLPTDGRTYDHLRDIFQYLKLDCIRLMTNNPNKQFALESLGIKVKREPLIITPTYFNEKYLQTKQAKLGHVLNIEE